MSIISDIIKTFDNSGFQDLIEGYTKEDIDLAIKAEIKDNIKTKLKIISSNWHAAEKVLGAVKTLVEVADEEEDFEEDDLEFDLGETSPRDFDEDEDEDY